MACPASTPTRSRTGWRRRARRRRRRSPRGSAPTCSPPMARWTAGNWRRSYLRTLQARRELEAIVHPAVYRAIAAGLRAFELIGGSPLAIVDVPLLYETGHQSDFDRVIVTVCPVDVQLRRLIERGLTAAEARQRLAAQAPAAEKAARADFVINTEGSFEETDRQVDEMVATLEAEGDQGQQYVLSQFKPPPRRDPAPARCAPRRTCSSRDSAGIARAARCSGTGTACRRADRGRTRRAA